MPEWWTYTFEDFLLFSPRVYWRMLELHNEAVWPLHIPALLLGVTIMVLVVRPRPWSGLVASAILVVVWIWVAWSFLWNRYSTINWAAAYVVPVFLVEALLLLWLGGLRRRLHFAPSSTVLGVIGLGLIIYALICHPFLSILAGRPIQAVGLFGIEPDPTVIVTLGVLSLTLDRSAALLLLAIPSAWCIVSWATLHTMGSLESWIPLTALCLAVMSQLWPDRPTDVERP
jgi:Family of unknown function (DUF6064)